MNTPDFIYFKKEIIWFQGPKDIVKTNPTELPVSDFFINQFPNMNALVQKARMLEIIKNENTYKLLSWDDKNGNPCGWLMQFSENPLIQIIEPHQLFVRCLGGIQESYNVPPDAFNLNQNYMFSPRYCQQGIGGLDVYYRWKCETDKKKPIDHRHWISFVGEASGNYTLYDPVTEYVYLFASDHAFKNISIVEGQPEYTFYTINGVRTFTDYVETLAKQWLEWVV